MKWHDLWWVYASVALFAFAWATARWPAFVLPALLVAAGTLTFLRLGRSP